MYATGKVAMAMADDPSAASNAASAPSAAVSQKGCFVIWQMLPNKWLIELVVAGHKVVAGSDGNVAWRHTPWLGAHAAKGGVRPLRRALQASQSVTYPSFSLLVVYAFNFFLVLEVFTIMINYYFNYGLALCWYS